MPIELQLPATFREVIAQNDRPQVGMWVCSGSSLVAEICAGSGLDWIMIDAEHSPVALETIFQLLQAVAPYPVTSMVRVPTADPVIIKQFLDQGAQNILVPMIDTPEQAAKAVRSVRYPPLGMRGVGSALSRGARWNRVENYLQDANQHVSLFVQIESATGLENAAAIAATDGVDGIFVGPADLSATMGFLGQQSHPEVVAAVHGVFEAAKAAGKPVGVNAFDPEMAKAYVEAGADFVLVDADVAMLARGSEKLADTWVTNTSGHRDSY